MAEATLEAHDIDDLEPDESGFYVRTDPFMTGAYDGPVGSKMCCFKLLDESSASFEWKTLSDELQEVGKAVMAGAPDAEGAASCAARVWLDERVAMAVADMGDEGEEVGDTSLVKRTIFAGLANGSIDTTIGDESMSAYHFESDVFLEDAAKALPLPPWARIESVGEGGPGSGYSQPALVLAKGHCLGDYARWLEARSLPQRRAQPAARTAGKKRAPKRRRQGAASEKAPKRRGRTAASFGQASSGRSRSSFIGSFPSRAEPR